MSSPLSAPRTTTIPRASQTSQAGGGPGLPYPGGQRGKGGPDPPSSPGWVGPTRVSGRAGGAAA